MACGKEPSPCRAEHIAPKLASPEPDGGDYEARCPVCGHGGFRISAAREKRYRHVWTCNCKRCKCDAAAIRTALLNLSVMPGCLGTYAMQFRTRTDPAAAALLESTVREILAVPGLKPSDMRIILAEALGEKVPQDFAVFIKWAMGLGISRSEAYRCATRWCRPSGGSSSPEGRVVDT